MLHFIFRFSLTLRLSKGYMICDINQLLNRRLYNVVFQLHDRPASNSPGSLSDINLQLRYGAWTSLPPNWTSLFDETNMSYVEL